MKRVVEVSEISKYAPHRPPMVWVDKVIDYGPSMGECLVHIKEDALYMEEKGLRASSCLEFIAQSYGFMSICHRVFVTNPEAKPLKRAFLASFTKTNFAKPPAMRKVRPGDTLSIKISGVRQMGPITLFTGQVVHDGTVLCESHMKVFSE